MRQLLNVEYSAEYESAASQGDVEEIKWRRELETPPPGRRRRGAAVSYISSDLERFMGEAI